MIVIYSFDASPPCRAVLLTAKALGIDVHIREVNLLKEEQLQPSFLKINPQHTIPTMDDGGFILTNSHAITTYLTQKYGKNDSLYPIAAQTRALVNQMMYFDEGTAFSLLLNVVTLIKGGQSIPEERKRKAGEIYGLLETFLKGRNWVSGPHVTIADFHLIATITSLNVLIPYSTADHPNIAAWIKKCESLPYYNQNKIGLNDFANMLAPLIS